MGGRAAARVDALSARDRHHTKKTGLGTGGEEARWTGARPIGGRGPRELLRSPTAAAAASAAPTAAAAEEKEGEEGMAKMAVRASGALGAVAGCWRGAWPSSLDVRRSVL